ncbi:MAG: DUF4065 domain-containing protein [Hyphomicrobiales bacterium]|nr:DUF4065 domain-containing protein [Hyphomicrobiales bacterium]
MMEPITCLQGAQALVQLAKYDPDGEGLTSLQVQKILYFANMLYIGKHGPDNPLIRGKFLTWVYGPAVRELYERMSRYERSLVEEEVFEDIFPIMNDDKKPTEEKYRPHVEVLKEAYERWGKQDSYKLIGISHWKKGAWRKSVRDGEEEIDNELIKEEYHARYG